LPPRWHGDCLCHALAVRARTLCTLRRSVLYACVWTGLGERGSRSRKEHRSRTGVACGSVCPVSP
ncbi:MAG TPA: hypothetical protein VK762_30770, partial [Polyangiaceae bacterium]|nr:hypothetical protein [Polyangiaceae bacterium]